MCFRSSSSSAPRASRSPSAPVGAGSPSSTTRALSARAVRSRPSRSAHRVATSFPSPCSETGSPVEPANVTCASANRPPAPTAAVVPLRCLGHAARCDGAARRGATNEHAHDTREPARRRHAHQGPSSLRAARAAAHRAAQSCSHFDDGARAVRIKARRAGSAARLGHRGVCGSSLRRPPTKNLAPGCLADGPPCRRGNLGRKVGAVGR